MIVQLSFEEVVILRQVCEEMIYGEVHHGDDWKVFLTAQSKLRHVERRAKIEAEHQLELLQITKGCEQ